MVTKFSQKFADNKAPHFLSSFSLLIIFFAGSVSMASSQNTVTLTQKSVAEMILKSSSLSKELDAKYAQNYSSVTSVLSAFDWKLALESGYENDRTATIVTNDLRFERFKTSASLSKALTTGTSVLLEGSRVSQRSDVPSAYSSTYPSRSTLDIFGVTLEQQLLANSFGASDRSLAKAAELQYESLKPLKGKEQQDLVLKGIRQFWDTYVAEQKFKQAVAARDSYLKLVQNVKRKTGYGYSNPGEVYQVQAELEVNQQKVRTTSSDYLAQRNILITILGLPADSEINLSVPNEIPPLPSLGKVSVENSREVLSNKLQLSSLEESINVAKNATRPALSIVGKLYNSGADPSPESSLSNALAGQNPKYYLGLKLAYTFGADAQAESLRSKLAAAEQLRLQLKRTMDEKEDNLLNAERLVQSNYAVLSSVEIEKGFREKAVADLNRAYLQGRTEIKNLIDAMNANFTSEFNYTTALGNYNYTLNQWAALRDELVKEEKNQRGDL